MTKKPCKNKFGSTVLLSPEKALSSTNSVERYNLHLIEVHTI